MDIESSGCKLQGQLCNGRNRNWDREGERGRERERRLTGGGKRGYKRRWLLCSGILDANANSWGIRHAFRVIDTDSPVSGIYLIIMCVLLTAMQRCLEAALALNIDNTVSCCGHFGLEPIQYSVLSVVWINAWKRDFFNAHDT